MFEYFVLSEVFMLVYEGQYIYIVCFVMSYKSCLTVNVLRSSNDASFACFFVVLFMYILVGVLVNSLSEKLREIWNVFEALLHLA